MFGVVRASSSSSSVPAGTSQLVWLKGSKGFVYTEAQPVGACAVIGQVVSCPMSGTSYTAVSGGNAAFSVPDRPQP